MTIPQRIPTLAETDRESAYLQITGDLIQIDSPELLLLKGHLVLENALTVFIETFQKHRPANVKFTFFQKLCICEILGLFSSPSGELMLDAFKTINKLRNDLAHNLKFDNNLINEFYKKHPELTDELVERTRIDIGKKTREMDSFFLLIVYLYVQVYAGINAMTEINNIYARLTTPELNDEIISAYNCKYWLRNLK
jgi:hypothetical protein